MTGQHTKGFRLEGRTALITGASREIGRAIATALADNGARVLIHYHRDRAAADQSAASIRESGGSALLLQEDLTKPDSGKKLARDALAVGPIDILVLNAAIQERQYYRTRTRPFSAARRCQFLVGHRASAGTSSADGGARLGPGSWHRQRAASAP